MARNEEKQRSELNRFVLAKENDQIREHRRPPLTKLTKVETIRHWIPDIKRDMNYCIQQIEGNRNYTDGKINEFKQRLNELEIEYKEFVKKAIELDPNPMWIPGEKHSYISKRAFESAKRSRENGEPKISFNSADSIDNTAHSHKRQTVPEFIQPILEEKAHQLQNVVSTTVKNIESSDDEEIATPLAIKKPKLLSAMDKAASTNQTSLHHAFNTECINYFKKKSH